MKTLLIENLGKDQKVYNSLMLDSKHLGIFSNGLAVRIINELAKQPLCAMDVAKKLGENEQKIYYHLRKMKKAEIIKLNGTEPRYGMIAKLFELVSPVIATKLYEEGHETKIFNHVSDPEIVKFFEPFILNGKMNCNVVMGDPYPHGEYGIGAVEGVHMFDFAIFLGKMLRSPGFPNYMLDTEARDNDLKSNLILVGNPKTNTIIRKVGLPESIQFTDDGKLVSSKKTYEDPRIGFVFKMENPLAKNKKILVMGGIRSRGLRAAVIAVTQYSNLLMDEAKNGEFIHIIEGIDKKGNKVIDSIKILE